MSAQVKAVARRRRDRADEPTVTRALQALQSGHIHVCQERCLLVRNRNAECLAMCSSLHIGLHQLQRADKDARHRSGSLRGLRHMRHCLSYLRT